MPREPSIRETLQACIIFASFIGFMWLPFLPCLYCMGIAAWSMGLPAGRGVKWLRWDVGLGSGPLCQVWALEMFKARLDGALGGLVGSVLAHGQGAGTKWSLRALSNPNQSMIHMMCCSAPPVWYSGYFFLFVCLIDLIINAFRHTSHPVKCEALCYWHISLAGFSSL